MAVAAGASSVATAQEPTSEPKLPSDKDLARSLSGDFDSGYADVNGIRLHYVAGGAGDPLVLLPGWPQTWWQFHKMMPELAEHYRVIAVDLRGMGGSDKPEGGYDKQTMARDIHDLMVHFGHDKVSIAGHDIGAMVAFSFAANYPQATQKIAMLDVPHPDQSWYGYPAIPQPGEPHLWWFAFNQVPDLPEQLIAGQSRLYVDWFFDRLTLRPASIDRFSRSVYAAAYSKADAIRSGNGWYQSFSQDIADHSQYGKVAAPILGLGGDHANYQTLLNVLPAQGDDVTVLPVKDCGHYLPEEQPETVVTELLRFFD